MLLFLNPQSCDCRKSTQAPARAATAPPQAPFISFSFETASCGLIMPQGPQRHYGSQYTVPGNIRLRNLPLFAERKGIGRSRRWSVAYQSCGYTLSTTTDACVSISRKGAKTRPERSICPCRRDSTLVGTSYIKRTLSLPASCLPTAGSHVDCRRSRAQSLRFCDTG